MVRSFKIFWVCTFVATLNWLSTGNALAQEAPQNDSAMEVGALTLKRQLVPTVYSLPGRTVAYEQVEIRPRVDGVVTKVVYQPGQTLKIGEPLFELDDAAYVASVESYKADLAAAEADLPVKKAAYQRALKLRGKGFTAAEVESAQSELAAAQATYDSAKSNLKYATTQLSWTTITSPIQGKAEVSEVSVGDLVTAGQSDSMTTITRLNPIYMDMLETSSRILSIRRKIDRGTLIPNEKIKASLILDDGEVYQGIGSLVTASATTSTSTGTITIRFAFDNPEELLLPGMFVRASVELGKTNAFLIPQRAAQRNSAGELMVYVIEDGKAKQVEVTAEGSYQNNWIVTKGVKEGQSLILDGLKTMSDGVSVVPVPAEVDEFGLVKDKQTDTSVEPSSNQNDTVSENPTNE